MKTLYEILGVKRNASQETIKKAFRKKAMETHPDRGGDKEEYELVVLAYDVLSTPHRKDYYDKTGKWEDAPDNTQTPTIQTLQRCLQVVLMELLQEHTAPDKTNVVKRMQESFTKALEGGAAAIGQAKVLIDYHKKFAYRVKNKKGEDNILLRISEFEVRDQELFIEMTTKNCEEVKTAMGMLEDYVYNVDFFTYPQRPTVKALSWKEMEEKYGRAHLNE